MSSWEVRLDRGQILVVGSRKAALDMADLNPMRTVEIRPVTMWKKAERCGAGVCKGVCRCACQRREGVETVHKSICPHGKQARS